MKRFTYIILFLIPIIASCQNNSKTTDNKVSNGLFIQLEGGDVCYSIGDHYAGEFIIGDEIPDSEYLEHFSIRKQENKQETLYVISEGNKDAIYIKPNIQNLNDLKIETIGVIEVVSEKFKTDRGISVGSSFQEFDNKYSEYSIGFSTENNGIILETEAFNGQFVLTLKDGLKNSVEHTNQAILSKTDLNPLAKIIMIRVF